MAIREGGVTEQSPGRACQAIAGRYWQALYLSTALAAILCAVGVVMPAYAQTVTPTGDVNPALDPPQAAWGLFGEKLYVGKSGTATLAIDDGGYILDEHGYIGYGPDSEGTASVSGVGATPSTWSTMGSLVVGYEGTGRLTIDDGGWVFAHGGFVGREAGSTGTVTVSGRNANGDASTWRNDTVTVGYKGHGEVTIKDGGTMSTTRDEGNVSAIIGSQLNSTGSVTVSGMDGNGNASTWTNAGDLYVGALGTGSLVIENGGQVLNIGTDLRSSFAGIGQSGTGNVTVSGKGSTFINTHSLTVGWGGNGTMIVTDGGQVDSGRSSEIGDRPDVIGAVTVSGADEDGTASTWMAGGPLFIGIYGSGTLTVEDGGKVSTDDGAGGLGQVSLGRFNGSAGALNIGTATGDADAEAGTLAAARVQFRDGDGTLNFNHTGATVFSAALESAGTGTHTLNHLAGTTTLTGDSSGFTGTATVSGGTLLVGDAAGNGKLGGVVNVGADGTLGGSGTLTGAVTIDGTLSAGNSPGTLTFADDLTLNAGATSVFELNSPGVVGSSGATGNDRIVVANDLTLGGTLEAYAAAAGYYRLFDYSGTLTGTFSGGTVTGTGGFVPATSIPDVQYGIAGQVNLSVLASGQTMQFWDGGDMAGNGAVDGGAGNWSTTGTNWTGQPGQAAINGTFGGSVGVFAGVAGGVVTLAGTQSFDTLQFSTGGYRLQGGILALGTAGGGTLNIDGGVSATIASTIVDGVGSTLRKAGPGTLVLGGFNTYTGGTNLLGGVLSVSSDLNLGWPSGGLTFDDGTLATTASFDSTRTVALDGAGRFDVATGTTLGLSGAVTGTGDLVKQGDGTLKLTGVNAYGSTQVEAGTLTGNAASISGNIANAATVVFEQSSSDSFSGDITGHGGSNGEMVKRGAGALTLIGTSSLDWSIEAGGLVTTANRFGGDASLAGGAALIFDQAGDASYGGVFSGAGVFTLTGLGAVTLTGDSSAFAGVTTVGSGNQLIVGTTAGGALGGTIAVGASGLLGGIGDLGSAGSTVTIAADGVHAPGSSQSVLGDYVNHGTLQVGASPTAANKVIVAGDVDITGATLDLVLYPADPTSWDVFNGPFTIIDKQSAGAVVGTFDPVTRNLLFLDTLLAYDGGDGNDVTLALNRNDITFAGIGRTANQIATGTAVESLGNTNPLWIAIALAGDQDVVRASFDALSGELHASAKTALIEDSRFIRNAANDRIRDAFATPGASYAPVLAYGPGDTPVLVAPDHAGPVFWAQGFGSWGFADSDGNAASLDHSTGGLLIGTDSLVGDWRFGLLAGYSHSRFDAKDRTASGDSDNYHLGLYGGTQWGNIALRTGAAYTWHDLSTSRAGAVPGIVESLRADYHAGTFQAFGELGYGIDMGSTRFEPFANLAHVDLNGDGFGETGGNAALIGIGGNTDVTFTTLGLHVEQGLMLGSSDATLKGMVGWRHAFGDTTPNSVHSFSAGNAFAIAGAPIAQDAAVIEAGLDLRLSPDAIFGLSYSGQVANGAQDHGFRANLNVRF